MSTEKSKILEAAQQFTIRGQIQKAIEEWKKLLTNTPNDANIYNTIGDLCLKNQPSNNISEDAFSYYVKAAEVFESSGFALKAIAVYKKILKIDPSRKEIYLRLGDLNCERGLIGNAREDYLFAAKLYTQGGFVKEALGVYRKIADLDPSNLAVRTKIAEIFLKEGLKREAIEEYNKVAVAHLKAGERGKAEDIYKLILKLEPNNVSAIAEIGRFHLESGHVEEAIGYGKNAFELSPDSPEVLSLLVDSYNKARMYDEAEALVTRILKSNPDQLSYRDTLASILLNKGDTQRASNEYLAIGKEYLTKNDLEKACLFAEKAANISPDMIAAHETLFEIYSEHSKKEEAIGKGLFLARYFHDAGDKERAKGYYLKILKEDPCNIEAKDGLEKIACVETPHVEMIEKVEGVVNVSGQLASAEVYIKYGLMEKAIAELQDIVNKIEPDNEEAHIRLKDIYKTVGEQDKAIGECLALLRICESSGDRGKMETVIREAMDINPEDRRVKEYKDRLFRSSKSSKAEIEEMFEEARFYAQQGMIEEAIDVYGKVLRIEADNEEALSRISALKRTVPEVTIPEVEIIQPAEGPSVFASLASPALSEAKNPSNVSFFDLGEALKEEIIEEPEEKTAPIEGSLAKSFEEIFQEFNEGLKAQLSTEDYETHYNLGIAYKEMELFQEAIAEFKLCVPGTLRFLDASYMIATCHRELGKYRQAIETLERAIASHQYNEQRHLVVKYELGLLLEMAGRKEDALRVFSQIHDTDATYRDVSERMLNLQRGT